MNSRIVLSLIACILLLGTAGVAYAGSVVTSIPVTSAGGVDVNPTTNIVYATSIGDSSVKVIDGNPGSPDENTVIATIPVADGPNGIVVNPTENLIYVASGRAGTFTVIDGGKFSSTKACMLAHKLSISVVLSLCVNITILAN